MTDAAVTREAREVIALEAAAVQALGAQVDDGFGGAVQAILSSSGRTILMGIGKSGIIAQKIAATLSSTGTPAYFLHPAEGMHGDLGMVRAGDVVIAVSYSGETPEIMALVPAVKEMGATLVALTGNAASSLARAASHVVIAAVDREACPLGLVPTASTTATLVMGDALAVCVMRRREFSEEDFAAFHPGGTLGRRLRTRVSAIAHAAEELPRVAGAATFAAAVAEIDAKKFGITAVTDENGRLAGVITDGDVRRAYAGGRGGPVSPDTPAAAVMSRNPKTVAADASAAQALHVMETFQITALFVVDADGKPVAVVHIHDILGRGTATADGE